MNYLGIDLDIRNLPDLDQDFIPMGPWMIEYEKEAIRPIGIAIEREEGKVTVFETKLRDASFEEANLRYLERYIKFCLWSVGGWKVTVCGCDEEAARVREEYVLGGPRDFDVNFMMNTYERPFEFEICASSDLPAANDSDKSVGGHLEGCRIGFDAGGSDRKVSAVIDGETVYSEEVVWHPKLHADPEYQYNGIMESMKTAASKMPRVDAIGVSSAGTFRNNCIRHSSLFIKVPRDVMDTRVKTMYLDIARELGNVPIEVANDGDVTALAGAMDMDAGCVLGIAMGTSEAGGYVDRQGNITGWLNELAFVPVDMNPDAMVDEWSGDYGCGVKYFSQDAVIKLAPAAGIALDEALSPAEKLKVVQKRMEEDDPHAADIYRTIGVYFGYSIAWYCEFYDIEHVLVMGRVTSGKGGSIIIDTARELLETEFPELAAKVELSIPDESSRRVGQSVAAASLPDIG